MDSARITYFDREAVERALDEYVKALARRHPDLEEVVLFGSLATGTPVPGSDVDLLLILRDSDRSFIDRIPTFLPSAFPVGVDVFPYTRAEAERMQGDRHSLVSRALRDGVVLFRR